MSARGRQLGLIAAAVLCGCASPLATSGPAATTAPRTAFVGQTDVPGRGTASLYVQRRERDVCLRLVRRWSGGERTERWRSCGFHARRTRLEVPTRISCAAKELHYLGVTPPRTERLVGRLSNGRRLKLRPFTAPPSSRIRGKLVMIVVRLPRELGGPMRAMGPRGRTIDSTIVTMIRGPHCGQPRLRDAKPLAGFLKRV